MATAFSAAPTGSLTDRVVIQQNTTTPDSQGGRSSSWVASAFDVVAFDEEAFAGDAPLAIVWANVRALGAREQLQSQAVGSDASYTVTVRYRADITPSMRLLWTTYLGSAKTLQILGVQPLDGRREFLALTCGEVV